MVFVFVAQTELISRRRKGPGAKSIPTVFHKAGHRAVRVVDMDMDIENRDEGPAKPIRGRSIHRLAAVASKSDAGSTAHIHVGPCPFLFWVRECE